MDGWSDLWMVGQTAVWLEGKKQGKKGERDG